MIDRRRFLQLFGAAAAAAVAAPAIPFGRVWSFPKEIVIARARPNAVRFVKAWDPYEARMLCRLDVLYGFGLCSAELPGCERVEVVPVSRSSEIQAAIDHLAGEHDFDSLPASVIEQWVDLRSEMPQIAGVQLVMPEVPDSCLYGEIYSGRPPGAPPVYQLKSPRTPD